MEYQTILEYSLYAVSAIVIGRTIIDVAYNSRTGINSQPETPKKGLESKLIVTKPEIK